MHVIAAKAVALKEAQSKEFKTYQRQVVSNAKAMAQGLSELGWRLISGGTDNHLMLIDLVSRGITGKAASAVLDKARITVNKNAIPFDTTSPMVSGGIRLGTPAVTTRGMKEGEMKQISGFIDQVLKAIEPADGSVPEEPIVPDSQLIEQVSQGVGALTTSSPCLLVAGIPGITSRWHTGSATREKASGWRPNPWSTDLD